MYIRPNGYKMSIIAKGFIISFAFLILTSCFGGFSDWTYQLPNDYSIVHINSESIVFGKEGEVFEQVIDRYITEFSYNDIYVGIKQFPVEGGYETDLDVDNLDYSKLEYYLVNTKKNIVLGPFNSEEYQHQCENLGAKEMTDWLKTHPAPKGAVWF